MATASYSFTGDANHDPSSDSETFAIVKAASTTTVSCSAGPFVYTGSAHAPCTATVTGAGGLNQPLPVTHANNVDAGTAAASASYAGDANHGASTGSATFAIDKASSTTTVSCPASVVFTGSPHTPCSAAATGAGGLNQAVTISYANNVNAGTATASATFSGGANHTGSTGSATFTILGYAFTGFFSPVDMSGATRVWNQANAGQGIPIKWLLTLNAAPVSASNSFDGLYSYQVSCTTGAGDTTTAIEEYTAGSSGLIYVGDGNWHYNWKTPKNYARTCRALYVRFRDGTTSPTVYFSFK